MFRIVTTTAALLIVTGNVALANGLASVDVPFGDLNLSQAQDARILADRLQSAANQVCRKANAVNLASGKIGEQAIQECIDTAINVAMQQVENHLVNKVRANLVSARPLSR
jgi:UrcA family protein